MNDTPNGAAGPSGPDDTAPPRVVVTGVGAISPQGPTADDLWDGVRAGRVAIREVQHLSMEGYRTRIAGEVEHVPTPRHDYDRPEGFRDRALDFALLAAEEAFDAGGGLGAIPAERWGVVMGTCNAGLISGVRWLQDTLAGRETYPKLLHLVTPQAIAELVAGAFSLRGPVLSVDTACAAGANAIGAAAELIRSGQADAALAGGTDALSDILISGFNSLESLSPEPAAPYSKDRQGLSLGEGSGVLVLMREDLAREAGLPALAEVLGYGLSADGYHPTAPHPEGQGAARAIRSALRAGGVDPSEVAYVNSHGTGTPKNDPAETMATRVGLGEAADRVAVSSTKSMLGHLLGAAGAVEGIVTVQAIRDQVAPPTANFTEPDDGCDLDYVPNEARPMPIEVAVSNNFAFGGANASVVLARPGRPAGPPRPVTDRVVVTGLAALTPAGCDLDAVWAAFDAGRDCTQVEDGVRIGRVELDPSPYLTPKERRRMDRLGLFAVISSKLALEDAKLEVTEDNRGRVGVIFGTGIGPMETMERFALPLFEEGPAAASPAVFPNTVYNAAAGQVAMRLGTVGPSTTVTAAHAAGASAISYAYDLARDDQADVLVCPVADTLTDTVVAAYRDLGMLAPDSFRLAEAGVALVLERQGHARARGARVYGEVLGYGVASDGLGVARWDPDGRGLERALTIALERAGLRADEVASVWLATSGYAPADAAELAAIDRVFGDGARRYAPGLEFGDALGAGGALRTLLAVSARGRGAAGGPAVVTSSSLGGTHFALVIAPSEVAP
jgi:3-oxoacyl-[acyl-carrier-protein] synthase II